MINTLTRAEVGALSPEGKMERRRLLRLAAVHRWRERCRAAGLPYGVNRPTVARKAALKKKYGITPECVTAMLTQQGGSCAICLTPIQEGASRRATKVNVDHCHTTGAVRGLLCHHCNSGLGHFKDNTTSLIRAVAYLGAHQC